MESCESLFFCCSKSKHKNSLYLLHTLRNSSQFTFLLWTELQHCVNDGQQGLPLTARTQEDELQKDILQIFQVGHTLLSLLVSLQTTQLALQQLAGGNYQENGVIKSECLNILTLNIVSFHKPAAHYMNQNSFGYVWLKSVKKLKCGISE